MQELKGFLIEAQALPRDVLLYLYNTVRLLPDMSFTALVQNLKKNIGQAKLSSETGIPPNVLEYIYYNLKRANIRTATKIVAGVDQFIDTAKEKAETTSVTGYNKMRELSQAINSSKSYLGHVVRTRAVWILPFTNLLKMKQQTLAGNTKTAASSIPLTSLGTSLKQLKTPVEQTAMRDLYQFAKTLSPDKLDQLNKELINIVR